MVEILVAGFAVAETMSVGGFAAVRASTSDPLARWAVEQILRDEVGHGAFGELAGGWAMREWSAERRRSMWPDCVVAMEAIELRTGGPVGPRISEAADARAAALGALPSVIVGAGMLHGLRRWAIPRLGRLGVLPE
jgi:hypothetical protein